MSKTHYIVYASKIRVSALLRPSEVTKLAEASRLRNEKEGITGFFCYGNKFFFQYLEGSQTILSEIFEQIRKDPRHTDLVILEEGDQEQRRFTKWSGFATNFEHFVTNYPPAHSFIPFEPYQWSQAQVSEFIEMFQNYYRSYDHSQTNSSTVLQHNGIGLGLSRLLGQYQFSMFFKVMMLILFLIAVLMFYNLSHFASFIRP